MSWLLVLAASTSFASSNTWYWPSDKGRPYVVQARMAAAEGIALTAGDSVVIAEGLTWTALVSCHADRSGSQNWDILCKIDDASLWAQPAPSFEGALAPVLAEMQTASEAATLRFVLARNGRVDRVQLKGEGGANGEWVTRLMSRAVASFGVFPPPTNGAVGKAWGQTEAPLMSDGEAMTDVAVRHEIVHRSGYLVAFDSAQSANSTHTSVNAGADADADADETTQPTTLPLVITATARAVWDEARHELLAHRSTTRRSTVTPAAEEGGEPTTSLRDTWTSLVRRVESWEKVELATTQEVDIAVNDVARLGWTVDSGTTVAAIDRIFPGEKRETADQVDAEVAHNARLRVSVPKNAQVKINGAEAVEGPSVTAGIVAGPQRIEIFIDDALMKAAKITVHPGTDVGCSYAKDKFSCTDIQWLK